ncbi:hypothetical protein [Hymenobacter rubripertinctus]|uniref:hypothetical protein n=1 Tax=Hymenobacter rubripertinctus TaxID=2029981 RepID=UPI0011C40F97|nr:hypothetical protein [Hymenobacter rubripertinctus]
MTAHQFAIGDPVNFNDPNGDRYEAPNNGGGMGNYDNSSGGGFGGMGGANRGYGGSPVNDWGSGFYGGGPGLLGTVMNAGGGSNIGSQLSKSWNLVLVTKIWTVVNKVKGIDGDPYTVELSWVEWEVNKKKGFQNTQFYFFPASRESEAYEVMLYLSKRDRNAEIAAYLAVNNRTNVKGVLIMPWAGNDNRSSETFIGSALSVRDRRSITTLHGNQYTALGYIHTHDNSIRPSDADYNFSEWLGLPSYTMTQFEYLLIPDRSQRFEVTGYTFDLIKPDGHTSLLEKK